MVVAYTIKRKRKKEHAGDLFHEVNSLIGSVYKKLSKKGRLLHGFMSKTKRTRTHRRKKHK